jgi:hypothetical protein
LPQRTKSRHPRRSLHPPCLRSSAGSHRKLPLRRSSRCRRTTRSARRRQRRPQPPHAASAAAAHRPRAVRRANARRRRTAPCRSRATASTPALRRTRGRTCPTASSFRATRRRAGARHARRTASRARRGCASTRCLARPTVRPALRSRTDWTRHVPPSVLISHAAPRAALPQAHPLRALCARDPRASCPSQPKM